MRVVTIAVVVALACVLGAVHGAASATPGVKVNADVSWPQSFATLPSMSREALAEHDGSDPDRPIYMAIKGFVFDVSSGRCVGCAAFMCGRRSPRTRALTRVLELGTRGPAVCAQAVLLEKGRLQCAGG